MRKDMAEKQEELPESVKFVGKNRGKLEIVLKVDIRDMDDLSIAYTPGVAEPARRIHTDKSLQYRYTARASQVAVVTDGSAVLGLGNIGPEAAHVVMEGKAAMLKVFAGVDAFPLCLATQDAEEIIRAVKAVEPNFSMIFLEDISAPRCFLIEERLSEELSIPVFHDDQHGTAVCAAAGLINALKLTRRTLENARIVINGAGASGMATTRLLMALGAEDITLCNSRGALRPDMEGLNLWQKEIVERLNKRGCRNLTESMRGADVFIGLSVAGAVSKEMVASMNKKPIVFAMANPVPEIMPPDALEAGAAVVGTGRSDFPNMVNNLLAFPGLVRGTLNSGAKKVTMDMKMAAARAIADCVPKNDLAPDNILPAPLAPETAEAVARAVEQAVIRI